MKLILLKNKSVPTDPYEQISSQYHHSCEFVPLLRHSYVNIGQLQSYFGSQPFSQVHACIVTSQRAVEALLNIIPSLPDQNASKFKNMPIYTVGTTTANALRKAGFKDVRGAENAGTGRVLAEIIVGESTASLNSYVFFTGEVRNDILPNRLKELNAKLEEIIVYKTDKLKDSDARFDSAFETALKEQNDESCPDGSVWVVVFAPSGVDNIVSKLAQASRTSFKLASIGPTTKAFLESKGLIPDVTSSKPDALHLLQAISE